MGFVGNPELDDGGLPGFRMAGSRWVSDELRLAVAAAARPLAEVGAPFVALPSTTASSPCVGTASWPIPARWTSWSTPPVASPRPWWRWPGR